MRILGYSWVRIVTEDFESTLRFFTERLGLSLTRLASGASRSDQGRVNSSATVGAIPGDI